jgi:hypothetical protein
MPPIAVVLAFLLLFQPVVAWAAPPPPPPPAERLVDVDLKIGVPLNDATKARPIKFELTKEPPAAGMPPVIHKIEVEVDAIQPGETINAAMKRKADAFVKAINAALGPKAAKVTIEVIKVPGGQAIRKPHVIIKDLYTVDPPKGQLKGGVPSIVGKADPTGEVGDGGKNIPLPGSTGMPKYSKPGAMMSIGDTDAVPQIATGFDAFGNASVVEFGVDNKYVARLSPIAGQSLADILQLLYVDLSAQGVVSEYDPIGFALYIENSLGSGAFTWSNSDTGLDFGYALTGSAPEPGTWAMLIIGFGLIGTKLRHRRAVLPA